MPFIRASRTEIQQYITKEGYEYDDDHGLHESLRCTITQEILVDPITTPCDHTFSKAALNLEIRRQHRQANAPEGSAVKCPLCNGLFTASDLKPASRLVSSVLDALHVICPFAEADDPCEWKGPRDKLPSHLYESCKGVSVRCPQQACRDWPTRGELKHHNDEVCPWVSADCPYCAKPDVTRGSLDAETGTHAKECPDWPVACGYCFASILRKDEASHRRGCDKSPAICSYAEWGCPFLGPPLSGPEHEDACHYVACSRYFQLYLEHAHPDSLPHTDRPAVATAILAAQRGLREQLEVERAKRASAQAQLLHIQHTLFEDEQERLRGTPQIPALPHIPNFDNYSLSASPPLSPSRISASPVSSTSKSRRSNHSLDSFQRIAMNTSPPPCDRDSGSARAFSSASSSENDHDRQEFYEPAMPITKPLVVKRRSASVSAVATLRATLPSLRRPSAPQVYPDSTQVQTGAPTSRAPLPATPAPPPGLTPIVTSNSTTPTPTSQHIRTVSQPATPVSKPDLAAVKEGRKNGFFAAVRRDFITLGGANPGSTSSVAKAVKAVAEAAEATEVDLRKGSSYGGKPPSTKRTKSMGASPSQVKPLVGAMTRGASATSTSQVVKRGGMPSRSNSTNAVRTMTSGSTTPTPSTTPAGAAATRSREVSGSSQRSSKERERR